MSLGGIFTSIKTWFMAASVGVKSTIVVVGVIAVTSAVAIPIAIITNTNHEEADITEQVTDNTGTSKDSKTDGASKNNASDQDDEEEIASNNDSKQDSTSNASSQGASNNTSSKPTNSTNSQGSSSSNSTKPQSNSNNSSQKPQTNTPPAQSSNPQPSTPTKTEEDLRNERDQQRRADMAKVKTGVTQFQTNNNGKLPITGGNADGTGDYAWQPSQSNALPPRDTTNVFAKFIRNYLNAANATENTFKDPDGWTYGILGFKYDNYINSSNKGQRHTIYLVGQAKCGIATSVLRTESARDFAVLYKLENGNNYCVDNQ